MTTRPGANWYFSSWVYVGGCLLVLLGATAWLLLGPPSHVLAKAVELFSPKHSSPDHAAFELAKIYAQTLLGFFSTLLLAAGAYIVVTHAKARNEQLQTSLARFNLVTALNQEIRTIYNSMSVYDPQPTDAAVRPTIVAEKLPQAVALLADSVDGVAAALSKRPYGPTFSKILPFISVLDRDTTWRDDSERKWSHAHGERTVPFVEKSRTVSPEAEIGTIVLHDYVHWFRRLKLGVEAGLLDWSDVDMYWRYLVAFVSGRRYSFMSSIFGSDMKDYAFLVEQLIHWEKTTQNRSNMLRYVCNVRDEKCQEPPDPNLLEEFAAKTKDEINRYCRKLAQA